MPNPDEKKDKRDPVLIASQKAKQASPPPEMIKMRKGRSTITIQKKDVPQAEAKGWEAEKSDE